MAERAHNDTVMAANLPMLSEKGLKGGHRCEGVYIFMRAVVVYARRSCGTRFKGQAWENEPPPSVGLLLAIH